MIGEAFASSLQHNVGMGVLALALSTSIWVFVTNEQNPPRTGIFPFRIPVQPVNVPTNLDVLGAIDPVVVRITAPTDLWAGLTESTFEATVDLAGLPEGNTEESVAVRARDGRVRVLEVVPPQVGVQLDQLRRQTLPVQVNIQQPPPLGFSYEVPRPEVQQVIVLGPERLVTTVDAAVADVNLSSSRSTVRQSFPLVARTARGYDISGVRLEPQSTVIEVAVNREISPVTLPVVADIVGNPAPGFAISQVRVTPQVVNLVGPSDLLQPLGNIHTTSINVGDLTVSITRPASLDLPVGVTPIDRSTVEVSVTILPVPGTATVLVAPRFRGVGGGLQAGSDPPAVELTVAGEGPALRAFNVASAQVTLDVAGRAPGIYEIEPQVELPGGLQVIRVTPSRLRVTVGPGG